MERSLSPPWMHQQYPLASHDISSTSRAQPLEARGRVIPSRQHVRVHIPTKLRAFFDRARTTCALSPYVRLRSTSQFNGEPATRDLTEAHERIRHRADEKLEAGERVFHTSEACCNRSAVREGVSRAGLTLGLSLSQLRKPSGSRRLKQCLSHRSFALARRPKPTKAGKARSLTMCLARVSRWERGDRVKAGRIFLLNRVAGGSPHCLVARVWLMKRCNHSPPGPARSFRHVRRMSTNRVAHVVDDLGNPRIMTRDSRFQAHGHDGLFRYLPVPNCLPF